MEADNLLVRGRIREQTVVSGTETRMMDALRNLMETLTHLPESYQQEAVQRIQPIVEELDDRAWDEAFADPRSDAFLRELTEETEREEREGKLIDLNAALGADE
jgi:hypothetical protein